MLMKNLIRKLKKSKEIVANQRGQGMLEYVLLVVVVVGLIVIARPFFNQKIQDLTGEINTKIGDVLTNN